MQDDQCDKNDLVHGQGHPDVAGKPGAEKSARRVWREAFGKGQQCTSPGAHPIFLARSKTSVSIEPSTNRMKKHDNLCLSTWRCFIIGSAGIRPWAISARSSLSSSGKSQQKTLLFFCLTDGSPMAYHTDSAVSREASGQASGSTRLSQYGRLVRSHSSTRSVHFKSSLFSSLGDSTKLEQGHALIVS